jgi:Rad3-related DNA helicase
MITHDTAATTEAVVKRFKEMDAPCILVSPSMATGWDFPGDECRWQIIVKLPYPDMRGNIMKSRSKKDPSFSAYLVMQQLIQAVGRGCRSQEDWCETFVTDDNVMWFLKRNKKLSVEWFLDAYKTCNAIPLPYERS